MLRSTSGSRRLLQPGCRIEGEVTFRRQELRILIAYPVHHRDVGESGVVNCSCRVKEKIVVSPMIPNMTPF